MIFLTLLATVAFAAIDKGTSFVPKQGKSLGKATFSAPFEFELDIYINSAKQPRYWRGVVNYGGDAGGKRGLGLWLYPGSRRLHVRTSTNRHGNDGCDPTQQIPVKKWTTIRVLVEAKKVTVSIAGKSKVCKYARGGIWKAQGKKDVTACSKGYKCFGGKIRNLEAFNNLPPVFSQCSKLSTIVAAKRQKLIGIEKASVRSIPVHQKALNVNLAANKDIEDVKKLCAKLTTVARKTVDALMKLLNKLGIESKTAADKAKVSLTAAKATLKQTRKQMKALDKNKVKCECAKLKADFAKPIAAKKQQNKDLDKLRGATLKAITLIKTQIKSLEATKASVAKQFSNPMFAFLKAQMVGMFSQQITVAKGALAKLQAKLAAGDKKKAANTKFINANEGKIKACAAKLAKLSKVLSWIFEDEELVKMIDDLNYFDEMQSLELLEENLNIEAYENELDLEEPTSFETQEDVEGVASQQVSLGLVGGAGVLTSGLFYYAYQKKSS